jgi:LytTr DNA-binding domain
MSDTQITTNQTMSAKKLLRMCAIALAAGILLGIIGPFGTFESMSTITRFSFWIGGIAVGMIIHIPLFYAAAMFGTQYRLPAWLWVSASAVVAAVPMTFVINGIFATMMSATNLDSITQLYPFVLAISLPMQWISYLTREQSVSKQPDPIVSAPALPKAAPIIVPTLEPEPNLIGASSAPKLISRLPARLGKTLICLVMEDHYVRVHTALGDTMIHMRMADAALELDGVEGMLVHRSYWVAREAITGWSRDGKTLTLSLSNGKSVPVARDRQPLVRAAGWLE